MLARFQGCSFALSPKLKARGAWYLPHAGLIGCAGSGPLKTAAERVEEAAQQEAGCGDVVVSRARSVCVRGTGEPTG